MSLCERNVLVLVDRRTQTSTNMEKDRAEIAFFIGRRGLNNKATFVATEPHLHQSAS